MRIWIKYRYSLGAGANKCVAEVRDSQDTVNQSLIATGYGPTWSEAKRKAIETAIGVLKGIEFPIPGDEIVELNAAKGWR